MGWKNFVERSSKGLAKIETSDKNFLIESGFKEMDNFRCHSGKYDYNCSFQAKEYFAGISSFLEAEGEVHGDDACAYISYEMIFLEWEVGDGWDAKIWDSIYCYRDFEKALEELFSIFKID